VEINNKKLLIFILLVSTIAHPLETYERKSISYFAEPFAAGGIAVPEVATFITEFRDQLAMPRFDTNPLPDGLRQILYDRLIATGSDTLAVTMAVQEVICGPIMEGLQQSAQGRAENLLTETERNSMVIYKLKMSGVTDDHIRKVFNSAYFVQAVVRSTEYIQVKDFLTKKPYMQGSVTGSLYWLSMSYQDSLLTVKPFKELSLSGSYRQAELTYADNQAGLTLKQAVFRKLWGGLMLDLQTESRKLEPFKLREQLLETSFNTVTIPLGKKSGVFLNQGFKIISQDDSKDSAHFEEEAGFVKVRKIGDDQSTAQIMYGTKLIAGMIIREYPKRGNVNTIALGNIPLHYTGDTLSPNFILKDRPAFLPALSAELGRESRTVNELIFFTQWILGYSKLSADVRKITDTGKVDDINHWALYTSNGLEKKWYLRRFAVLLRAGLFLGSTLKSWDEENDRYTMSHHLYGLSFGAQGKTGFEWMVDADRMIGVRAGYQYGISAGWIYKIKVKSNDEASSGETVPSNEESFDSKAKETCTGPIFELYYRKMF
jgi:hypothetical protein